MKEKELRKQLTLKITEVIERELAEGNQAAAENIKRCIVNSSKKIARKYLKQVKKEEKKLFKKQAKLNRKSKEVMNMKDEASEG